MIAGVYTITNISNGKLYVGSTIHTERRRLEHFSALATNKHVNKHLQNAYNKEIKNERLLEKMKE